MNGRYLMWYFFGTNEHWRDHFSSQPSPRWIRPYDPQFWWDSAEGAD